MDLVDHDNRSPLSLLERYLLRYHVEDRARVLFDMWKENTLLRNLNVVRRYSKKDGSRKKVGSEKMQLTRVSSDQRSRDRT